MTVDGWITVVVLLGVIAMLALTSYGQDLIMLAGLTVLLSAGVLNGHDALAGFANEGIATVGILFVVAAGLRETGAVHSLAQRVLGRPRTRWRSASLADHARRGERSYASFSPSWSSVHSYTTPR